MTSRGQHARTGRRSAPVGGGRHDSALASHLYSIVVDSKDPAALARWWARVLDYDVVFEAADEVAIAKKDGTYPGLVFLPVPEGKGTKNRLHIDLNPDDQAAEVERLLALGATHRDIGQGDVHWVVLADIEGNEFCVLTARDR
jgi:hypothetical protein